QCESFTTASCSKICDDSDERCTDDEAFFNDLTQKAIQKKSVSSLFGGLSAAYSTKYGPLLQKINETIQNEDDEDEGEKEKTVSESLKQVIRKYKSCPAFLDPKEADRLSTEIEKKADQVEDLKRDLEDQKKEANVTLPQEMAEERSQLQETLRGIDESLTKKRAEIRKILTVEKKKVYNKLIAERERLLKEQNDILDTLIRQTNEINVKISQAYKICDQEAFSKAQEYENLLKLKSQKQGFRGGLQAALKIKKRVRARYRRVYNRCLKQANLGSLKMALEMAKRNYDRQMESNSLALKNVQRRLEEWLSQEKELRQRFQEEIASLERRRQEIFQAAQRNIMMKQKRIQSLLAEVQRKEAKLQALEAEKEKMQLKLVALNKALGELGLKDSEGSARAKLEEALSDLNAALGYKDEVCPSKGGRKGSPASK
ncbi:MAG: hypothetical protein D6797_02640, partial [Bdellovibrio sp.]